MNTNEKMGKNTKITHKLYSVCLKDVREEQLDFTRTYKKGKKLGLNGKKHSYHQVVLIVCVQNQARNN